MGGKGGKGGIAFVVRMVVRRAVTMVRCMVGGRMGRVWRLSDVDRFLVFSVLEGIF